MSNWEKIKIAISIFVFMLLTVLTIFVININNSTNKDNNREQSVVNILNMNDDYDKIIYAVAQKDIDWSNLPLSNDFKKKYNNKRGILEEGDNYTKISYSDNLSNKEEQKVVLIVAHDLRYDYYYIHYIVNDKNELDDVEIIDKVMIQDENGREVIYKETMDGAFVSNIVLLAAPARLEYDPFDYIYVTDNYLKKWSGGFIDYDISCGIEDIGGLEDKEKQLVYLYVVQDKFDENGSIIGDEWEKYFKVHYFVNEDMWLDDVEVEEVNKAEIDRLLKSVK